MDRLGPERAKEELRVKNALAARTTDQTGDTKRIESICKWYTAMLALQNQFLSIEEITTDGPNDLRITWNLPPVPTAAATSSKRGGAAVVKADGPLQPVTLVLRFDSTELGSGGGGGGLLVDASVSILRRCLSLLFVVSV